ncbi:MAG: MBL fold metallo-hydrolase [Alphaproteobacteria bacterium]|jgi:glyoxylase-like metal-dependent hydrolase (beta-lactamase superfamily II)|nr:MBL fold metallo-hydrolase [Alphaproteobacteria bacterium]HJP21950.1 MBL fold metallo-hydrolase [Alphaproteobacteria bacterium]
MQPLTFADVTVERVVEAEGPGFAPGFLLPESDLDLIAAERDWLEPHFFDPATERLIQSQHTFVVRTPHHTILVDTCVGNDKDRPSSKAWHHMDTPYLEKLGALGVAPEAVDFVLCTHLHVDHVGWNTRLEDGRWVPTFPNAKYLFHREEMAFWEEHGDYVGQGYGASDGFYEDSVLPVMAAGQGVLVAGDHAIDDRLRLEPTPGHSPGHVVMHLDSGEGRAVFSGDMLHHPIQVAQPTWNSRYCWDPEMSAAARSAFVERHTDSEVTILAAHFAVPTAGRIVSAGSRRRFQV